MVGVCQVFSCLLSSLTLCRFSITLEHRGESPDELRTWEPRREKMTTRWQYRTASLLGGARRGSSLPGALLGVEPAGHCPSPDRAESKGTPQSEGSEGGLACLERGVLLGQRTLQGSSGWGRVIRYIRKWSS